MRQLNSSTSLLIAISLLCGMASAWPAAAQEFAARERLRTHSAEFRKEVIKVTDGVWVAVGFSNANSALIVGDGGSIIVDTTSNVADASDVKAEFAKLSDAPVRAIIYTHAHPDHTGGAGVFAGDNRPDIIVHQLFVDRVADVGRADRDGGDQFGSTLPDSLFINVGTRMGVRTSKSGNSLPGSNTYFQWRPPGSDNRRRSTATPSHAGRDTREHGNLAS